jgi:hypothetical protein
MTHDEVNARLARRIARHLHLKLTVLGIKDAEHAISADQLVLDLDHLPADCKTNLLSRVRARLMRAGVSVHSYCLTRGEACELRHAGVKVTRRLSSWVLIPQLSEDSSFA